MVSRQQHFRRWPMQKRSHSQSFQVSRPDFGHLGFACLRGNVGIPWPSCMLGGCCVRPLSASCAPSTPAASHGSLANPAHQEGLQDADANAARAAHMEIWGMCKQKRLKDAMDGLMSMVQGGVEIGSGLIAEVLLLCSGMGALEEGRKVHGVVTKKGGGGGVGPNSYLHNNLVNMYAKCGSLAEAREVFSRMRARDAVSWNAMIAGYAKGGHAEEAMELLSAMLRGGEASAAPDRSTLVCALRACGPPMRLRDGARKVHNLAVVRGLERDAIVAGALAEVYACKFGRIDDAKKVFEDAEERDVVLWTSIVSGSSDRRCGGGPDDALGLFQQMLTEGVPADGVVVLALLGACASPAMLEHGRRIHARFCSRGIFRDPCAGSALVDMYARCGDSRGSRRAFDALRTKDAVSWTALMAGHERRGDAREALKVFCEMEAAVEPSQATLVSLLNAIAPLAAPDSGSSAHACIASHGYESDLYVASALVGMYAKCGRMQDARAAFDQIPDPDTAAWNAMIDGFAHDGDAPRALASFEAMAQADSAAADRATILAVLSACNHAGLVPHGCCHFRSMTPLHGIAPNAEHRACIVDILARSGRLEAAAGLLQALPIESSLSAWMVVLSSCRFHGDVAVAERAIASIVQLEPRKEAAYALLSSVYALEEGKRSDGEGG